MVMLGFCLALATLHDAHAHTAAQTEALIETTTIGFPPNGPAPEVLIPSDLLKLLRVPDGMRALVRSVWEQSPTFRRQCARLVEASVTVKVRTAGSSGEVPTGRALTSIVRDDGAIARVDVYLVAVDAEYLAHEIEHVLEQLDGVNLRLAAARRVNGVTILEHDRFETARAVAVGHQVAREHRSRQER